MFRAIIVDDEPNAVSSLRTVLKWYCEEDVEVVGDANDLSAGWSLIQAEKPDLAFLDIEVGKENGFMLLEKIRKFDIDIHVIFTTAHTGYAINAIRKEAFDYLLKPVDGGDLQTTIARLKEKTASIEATNPAKEGNSGNKGEGGNNSPEASLSLPMQDQVLIVPFADIVRCESDRNYTRFFLADGSNHLISKNLGSFQDTLSRNNFFRSHKSHFINLSHLKSYIRPDGGYLLMKDGSQVPLSRGQRPILFELLGI